MLEKGPTEIIDIVTHLSLHKLRYLLETGYGVVGRR